MLMERFQLQYGTQVCSEAVFFFSADQRVELLSNILPSERSPTPPSPRCDVVMRWKGN